MAYTFGASTANDINATVTAAATAGINSSCFLVAGWWYPTTLTAGRAYCGEAAGAFLRVAATTSELAVQTDRLSIDATFTSSGAGITTNVWQFIAIVTNFSTNGFPAHYLWVGSGGAVPVPVTISQTTLGSGNGSGSANRIIGNSTAAATVAFQGDIGQVSMIYGSTPLIMGIESNGSISQPEVDRIFATIVLPLFYGNGSCLGRLPVVINSQTIDASLFDQESNPAQRVTLSRSATALLANSTVPTIGGPSVATQRQLGPLIDLAWPSKAAPMRRR